MWAILGILLKLCRPGNLWWLSPVDHFLELAQSFPIRLADPDDSQQWHDALSYSTLQDVGEVDLGPLLTSPEQVRDLIIQESS